MRLIRAVRDWWASQTSEHKQNIMFIGPCVFIIELIMAYTRHNHKTEASNQQEKLARIKMDLQIETPGSRRHKVMDTYYRLQEEDLFDMLLKPVEQTSRMRWLAFIPSFIVRVFFSALRENNVLCRVDIPDSVAAKLLNLFSGAPYKPGNVSVTVVQVLLSRLYRPVVTMIFPPAMKPLTMEQQVRRQQRLSAPPEQPGVRDNQLRVRIDREGIEDLINKYPDIADITTADLEK